MAWYDYDTWHLAKDAENHLVSASSARLHGNTYDTVKAMKQPCANAYWWLYEYKQGQGEQEIRALVQKYLNNPTVQANKDDLEHQRLARIAGYWVPGRRPGVPNKPNPNKQVKSQNSGNSQNTSKNTGNSAIHTITIPLPNTQTPVLMSSGVSTAPEDIDRLIDTSSLSTPEVWSVIVALLQSASKDSREPEHLEIIQDTIQVLYPLTQPKF